MKTKFVLIIILLLFSINLVYSQSNPDKNLNLSQNVLVDSSLSNFGYLIFRDSSLKVLIDSNYVDLGSTIKVNEGKHQFIVFDPKDSSILHQKHYIDANKEYSVILLKEEFSLRKLLPSSVLPGLGQLFDESYYEGFGFAIPFITTFGLYLNANAQYTNEFQNYLDMKRKYSAANNEMSSKQAREKLIESQNKLNNQVSRQKLFGLLALGVYFLNVADVLIFHSFFDNMHFNTSPVAFPNKQIGYQFEIKYWVN